MKQIAGTAGFMAPEVHRIAAGHPHSTYDFKADVWAIGVCAYILMTNQHPFSKHHHSVGISGVGESFQGSPLADPSVLGHNSGEFMTRTWSDLGTGGTSTLRRLYGYKRRLDGETEGHLTGDYD